MVASAQDWTDRAFLDEAHAWILASLDACGVSPIGAIVQQHVRPWSTVMRVPTDRGAMYFKANLDTWRHEAAVADFLSRRRPDVVPPLVAVDLGRGWMLMEDAGARLREVVEEEHSLERWLAVLPLYASLQLDMNGTADDLIALGLPDMRLARLPGQFDSLLNEIEGLDDVPDEIVARARQRAGAVAEMCRELARHGIPETIQHDDLNDGQIYIRDGRPLILDWGDACVSQPFFSMSVALEGVIAWGVDDVANSVDTAPFLDAYLAPFADKLGKSMGELRLTSALAIRLGWACRAANGHVHGEDATPTVRRLQMFLDGHV